MASRWRHCVRFDRSGNQTQTSRTDSDVFDQFATGLRIEINLQISVDSDRCGSRTQHLLYQQVGETQRELDRVKLRAEEHVASAEQIAHEHCERATRLATEVNELRVEQLRLKKEIR